MVNETLTKRKCLDILVLSYHVSSQRPEPLNALDNKPDHYRLHYANASEETISELGRRHWFDVVVLQGSLLALRQLDDFHNRLRPLDWLRDYPALKIALPKQEYDHAELLDEWMYYWQVPVIFSNYGEAQRRQLYPILHDQVHFVQTYPSYVNRTLAQTMKTSLTPCVARGVDIAYRTHALPYTFGEHGQFQQRLGNVVRAGALAKGLTCDISARRIDEIGSEQWLPFLTSSKTVLGTESGAGVLDHRGQIAHQHYHALQKEPDLRFEEFASRLPSDWDRQSFFTLGSQHFDAILTKTVQILVEGKYEGVLVPGRHYLELKRDLSNLDSVLERVREPQHLQAIADTAYTDIVESGRYDVGQLSLQFDEVISKFHRHPSLAWKVSAAKNRSIHKANNLIQWTMSRVSANWAVRRLAKGIKCQVPLKKPEVLMPIVSTQTLDLPSICQGRLTAFAGDPLSGQACYAANTLFFTPYQGNRLALHTGEQWRLFSFNEIPLALNQVKADRNYDVYISVNSEKCLPELELVPWAKDRERSVSLATFEGIVVKLGHITHRYLGTLRGSARGQTQDSPERRLLWNHNHGIAKNLFIGDTNCHEYQTPQYEQPRRWNSDANFQLEIVLGQPQMVSLQVETIMKSNQANEQAMVFPILDEQIAIDAELGRFAGNYSPHFMNVSTSGCKVLMSGYHTLGLAEQSGPCGATFANAWLRGSLLC